MSINEVIWGGGGWHQLDRIGASETKDSSRVMASTSPNDVKVENLIQNILVAMSSVAPQRSTKNTG